MIQLVDKHTLQQAAEIHAIAWRESHRSICSEEFIALHTTERQIGYLQRKMESGADIYLLFNSGKGVGVVSVQDSLIGDLYVLPEEQRKGYGAMLLRIAVEKCTDVPTLWVLDNNQNAIRLYERAGFYLTGAKNRMSDTLAELEMICK